MRKQLDWENAAPLHRLPVARTAAPHLHALEDVIEYAAQMLPAEGPITGFAFLNPLHAFEHLPFDEAVKIGVRLFGGQPYLPEARYREELAADRIRAIDLQAVLETDLGVRAWESIVDLGSRHSLRMTMLRHPILIGSGEEFHWFMAETEALAKFRSDVPRAVRNRLTADALRGAKVENWSETTREAFAVKTLWRVCNDGVRSIKPASEIPWLKVRPRDVLLDATGADSDGLVHEHLIRFCAAFADQGYAPWRLPHRELGFYKSFLKLYRSIGGPPDRWLRGLARELGRLDDAKVSPMESIHESLAALGISPGEWEDFFPATLLAFRGWASMIRQMEVRSDRFPVPAPPGALTEYLAVRLILERFALTHLAREELIYQGPLKDLRKEAQTRIKTHAGHSLDQRAFLLFQLAQILGWSPSALQALTRQQWTALVAEIEAFSSFERRRVFQLALEHHYRVKALDALTAHTQRKSQRVQAPQFQVSFCIDAREESFRRHIEEICPRAETFAAAGFYSVPIYYRGLADANYAPLCPIVMKPTFWMTEEPSYALQESNRRRAKTRRMVGLASHQFERGSQSFALGALLSGGLGVLASIPLVARVLFPRLTASIVNTASSIFEPPPITRLTLERTAPNPGKEPDELGFTLEEMAGLGERVLRDIGLTSGFARIFFFLGHRSSCLNNPHKSAYDCGACTGPGGPNARALAMMLNDRRVRAILAQRNLPIPDDTIFIGGFHNTAVESVTFYDLDFLPRSHVKDFEAARDVFEKAADRNAHERCRRFDSAPLNISAVEARRHVEGRSEDLAQVRPEFGNATNALCFVGRRQRVRDLFMDRRCFMHSYDAGQDTQDSAILARILSAVIPVCEGISLQYYFSSVDSNCWGSGTKLPHNVTSLLGVMDGAASDLRQGLPWQGVEIHEPLRLLFVIESTPEAMMKIIEDNPTIGRIIRNAWSQLAVLDPGSSAIQVFSGSGFEPYHPESAAPLPQSKSSRDCYQGSRTFLDFTQIGADA